MEMRYLVRLVLVAAIVAAVMLLVFQVELNCAFELSEGIMNCDPFKGVRV